MKIIDTNKTLVIKQILYYETYGISSYFVISPLKMEHN